MASDTFEVRISLQRLLLGLILSILPISFFGLYLSSESDASLEKSVGAHFRTIAQLASAATSQFINDRVVAVGTISAEPLVVEAVAAASRSYKGANGEAAAARIGKIEEKWDTPQADSVVKELLSSASSKLLLRRQVTDPRILKIVVADENGATLAATDKPLHYLQPDKQYWQAVYGQGRGGVYVSEVLYDEQSRSNYISVGMPVLDPESHRFIGAVNALVDVSGIFSFLKEGLTDRTIQTTLLRDDGTVVTAANVSPTMRLKSEEYRAVSDALGTLQGRSTGFAVATMKGGNRIIAFADTGLKQIYPNLAWLVLVSQDEREALAPARTFGRFALLMMLLSLLMLTLLAVYFFLHRRQRVEDIEAAGSEVEPPRSSAASA